MSEPLPYSDVVKLESFLWEECMVLLPHPLDCAGWIYVIGLRDMALDEKTCDELKMTDLVLGLEIDFWDEIPRVKLYEEDIHWFLGHKDECKTLFEGFARTYIQKISDGFDSHWLKKSAEVPDEKLALRPQWILDWQAAPIKKGWQLPPTDKKEVVLKSLEPAENKAEPTPRKTDSRPNIKTSEIALQEPDQDIANKMQELARQRLGQGTAVKKPDATLKKMDANGQKPESGLGNKDTGTQTKKPNPKQPEQSKTSTGHTSVTLRRLKPQV